MPTLDFLATFQALTGNRPFPWQHALYERFLAGDFPKSCNLPTGLGKTSVIPIWLIALAEKKGDGVPRRLVYVVNRRTVVDQATREAENLREKLTAPDPGKHLKSLRAALEDLCAVEKDPPLAISTLRGQFADNREWSRDPARPAIIVGTVDMIGSRLLFSGYGCGFKTHPLHAGFLGQDSLLVHDEAHLEKPFQDLIEAIEEEQAPKQPDGSRRARDYRPLRVMALTATPRGGADTFGLDDEDRGHSVVLQRINAAKRLAFHEVADAKKVAAKIADLAHERGAGHPRSRIIVFVRTVEAVGEVRNLLKKKGVPDGNALSLTGTMRGLERDGLVEQPLFQSFLPSTKRKEGAETIDGTVYLVCTSAGEVGVDISADHLVCDLTPYDSMAQRFGRVNRFGDGDARIDVVYEKERSEKSKNPILEERRWLTLELLRELNGNASPAALGRLDAKRREAAFSPTPEILPVSDILFDAWALTTVRDKLPGRPPVADWLHGVSEWQSPETYVAWREEVELLTPILDPKQLADVLEDYPLKPHELLRDRTDRVVKHLEGLAGDHAQRSVWAIDRDGTLNPTSLGELVRSAQRDKEGLRDCIVLLPPAARGLTTAGMLGNDESMADFDVADEWFEDAEKTRRRRIRGWDGESNDDIERMRLVRTVDTRLDADDGPTEDEDETVHRFRRWYVRPWSADDDGSKSLRKKQVEQGLDAHNELAGSNADKIVEALNLSEPARTAVPIAAEHHDDGKRRRVWQMGIGNPETDKWLAKSGRNLPPKDLTGYRHEFGSMLDVSAAAEFRSRKDQPDVRELILHLIAAHHGRARPHFPVEEMFDPDRPESESAEAAIQVVGRFGDLQRRYGRWGLAYLESLVRASDYLASEGQS